MLIRLLFGASRQLAYTVHTPPHPASDRLDQAEQLVFVKDGFTPSAFVLGPFWLAAHGVWWAVAGYLAVAATAIGTAWVFGFPSLVAASALFAINVLVGFEADEIRRLSLEQQGWQTIGSVTGETPLECERRFFDMWLPSTAVRVSGPRPQANLPGASGRFGLADGAPQRGLWRRWRSQG